MGDQPNGSNPSHAEEIEYSPVELSKIQSTKRGTPANCNECGSPLSDSSQFCWMCGASRDRESDPRVDWTRPALANSASAPNPALADVFVPPIVSSRNSVAPGPGPLGSDGLFSEVPRSVPEYQASAEPNIFDPSYRPKPRPSELEQPKQFDVRTAIALALFLTLICLAYWQRNNAKALLGLLKADVAQKLSSFWSEDNVTNATRHQPESVTHRSSQRAHAPQHTAPPDRQPHVTASTESYPLGVKVRHGTRTAGPVVTATDGIYHSGVVEVGISESWIANARLSPMAIEISPRESLALLIKRVPPVYPESAREAGVQGSVALKVVIKKDGNVGLVRALSGDPALIPAAIDCVRQWVYKPYYRDGEPTDVETVVTVDFVPVTPVAEASPR